MRPAVCFITILLGFSLVTSCVFNRMLPLLEDVDSYIQERPDSALAVLEKIDPEKLTGKKETALYSLLHTMALDKNYKDPMDKSLIEPAVRYYSKHGDPDIRLKAFFYKGRISLYNGHFDEAILSYMEGYRYIDKCKDYKYCGFLCDDISRCFINTYNQDEALVYLKKAKEYYEKGNLSVFNFNAAIPLVTIYMNQKEWSKADSVFCSVEGENLPTSIREGIYEARARYYTYAPDHDYALANEFYSELISLGADIQFSSLCSYAYSLDKCGHHKESDAILLQAANSINENQSYKGRYNSIRSNIEESRGNYKESLQYLKESVICQNEDIDKRLQNSAVKAQRDFFVTQKTLAENIIIKQRARMTYMALASLLLLWVFLLFFRIQRKKLQKEKNDYAEVAEISRSKLQESEEARLIEKKHFDELLEETARLRDKLSGTEKTVSSLESIVSDRDKSLSDLRMEYSHMYKEKFRYLGELSETYFRASEFKEPQQHVYEKVQRLIKDISGDQVGQQRFERMIDKNLDNIMKHFREDFPHYSEEDYRFISYMFVGFDSTTLLVIFGMPSQSAVYMKKNRIKNNILKSSSQYKEFYLRMLS